jgi:isoamylase
VPAFWARQFGLRSQNRGDVGGWLTGSRDVFTGRAPLASVNYVDSHDGLTAADKVAANTDMGAATIKSVNTEAIGAFVEPRRRRLRNLLATVLVSQGVPMLLGGDELGRSQNGNGNAYDVDCPTSWYDWSDSPGKDSLKSFVAFAIDLRKNLPALRRANPLFGGADSAWYALDATPMSEPDWEDPARHGVAFWVRAQGGEPQDPDVLIILNAADAAASFPLPADWGTWELRLDTSAPDGRAAPGPHAPGEVLAIPAEALLVAARTA